MIDITKNYKTIEIDQFYMSNKLFCSFSEKDKLEERLKEINSAYKIMYDKIFVLSSPESEEYMCTYNIIVEDPKTVVLPNTILLHRKKESNTLYTINALNTLIMSLNGGMMDTRYPIQWQEYKNCILLTQGSGLRRLNTVIHKIIHTA